ncbi:unnamed protein product [Cuscuta europaea]|uniref:5'-3' DNA helicase ZGRF1-like N-terminal domain-containing protein n=1 Tax=Cuscuta europaea TaxID=41803 RepID=A0A9P1E034_CUSEU|nr:unnamed protein product [Cuscuta europaea]
MGDVKRWDVTYTKHIKQKRKVYQDGFLEVHSSSHKVTLYDDCENVLGSKFMKIESNVKSGETLAFDSFLVDIGDLHGEHKPTGNETSKARDKNIDMKPRSLHNHKFRNSSVAEDRKPYFREKKALPSSLSPSQKLIREFKKVEVQKYSSSPSCLDTTKSCDGEWQVLYTTQLTQKAKKFHDGFLRVSMSGSQCKQAMLYDAAKGLLGSKFLKASETIQCGESITFDGFLVEIGECEGNQKPLQDSSFQGRNIGVTHDQLHCQRTSPSEWDVMYTSQLTQKRKKYNSGVLRLSSCGSFQSQVTLLTEGGDILGRRFLKSSEHVETGATLNLLNYLVEVGEAHTALEEPQHGAYVHKDTVSITKRFSVNHSKFSRGISANNSALESNSETLHCKAQNRTSLKEGVNLNTTNSSFANSTIGAEVSKKHVRAACEILCILKKPIISGRVSREGASTDEIETMQPSDHKRLRKEEDEETIITDTTSCKPIAVESNVYFRENLTGEILGATTNDLAPNFSKMQPSSSHESSVEIGIPDGKEEEGNPRLETKRKEKSFEFALGVMQHFQETKECEVEPLCPSKSESSALEMAVLRDTEDNVELNTGGSIDDEFPSFDLGF